MDQEEEDIEGGGGGGGGGGGTIDFVRCLLTLMSRDVKMDGAEEGKGGGASSSFSLSLTIMFLFLIFPCSQRRERYSSPYGLLALFGWFFSPRLA